MADRYFLRERKAKLLREHSFSPKPSPRKTKKARVAKEPFIGPQGLTDEQIEELRSPRPPRRKWPHQSPPITDPRKIPKRWNWTPNDLDLDEHDLEGNIERCYERIEEGIMPQIFEKKLKSLKRTKEICDRQMDSEPKELGEWVIRRLNTLKQMEPDLRKRDPYGHLPIVRALIKAYRSGELKEPVDEQVTYWSNGTQIEGPRKWDLKDFRAIHHKHGDPRSFWVEGVGDPGPVLMATLRLSLPQHYRRSWHHTVFFEIRIPGTERGAYFPFMDDTGAGYPVMWEEDADFLMAMAPQGTQSPPLSSVSAMTAFGAQSTLPALVLEGRVIGPKGAMSRWQSLFIVFAQKQEPLQPRLSGSWWRYMLFTASWPTRKGEMMWCDTHQEFLNEIPCVHPMLAEPPTVPNPLPPSPPGLAEGGGDGGDWLIP